MEAPMVDCGNNSISRIVLRGYKSIAECDLELGSLNVLIGGNGVGKSNLMDFFRLVNQIINKRLQLTTGLMGGADALLHFGCNKTEEIEADLYFGDAGYHITLQPTVDKRLTLAREVLWGHRHVDDRQSSAHFETRVDTWKGHTSLYNLMIPDMRRWRFYHFNDTSKSALIKQIGSINDNEYLREDASNLAAFLLRLRDHHNRHYQRIVETVRLIAPFFSDFHLEPTVNNQEKIQLEWIEDGQDKPFTASVLSDGVLRFICLATVLLQPEEFMSSTVFIDEPELGQHPFSIRVLAGLMKSVAMTHQLIAATQSVGLVNELDLENLIVMSKEDGASMFKRPNAEKLEEWLLEYPLGELWMKNLLGGRPEQQYSLISNSNLSV